MALAVRKTRPCGIPAPGEMLGSQSAHRLLVDRHARDAARTQYSRHVNDLHAQRLSHLQL